MTDARRRHAMEHGPLWSGLLAYERFADRFAEWTGKVSQFMVLPTVVVGFVNVILRYTGYLTGTRLTNNGLIETQWYLYSLIFLFGFPYILKHNINPRVDFWFAHQPPHRKAWIDLIGHLVALVPFTIFAIYLSVPQVVTSWRLQETSPDPSGLPRYPIKTMLMVAFVLLLIQALGEVVKLVAVLRGYEDEAVLEEPEAPIRVE
jgi:TRAP-type mannitol/chloroaromatic compound transport system permease small subunit